MTKGRKSIYWLGIVFSSPDSHSVGAAHVHSKIFFTSWKRITQHNTAFSHPESNNVQSYLAIYRVTDSEILRAEVTATRNKTLKLASVARMTVSEERTALYEDPKK